MPWLSGSFIVLGAMSALFTPAQAVAVRRTNSSLPVVNLGYEYHQAISFNDTGGYYNFSNVRYAAPPIGDLRFRAPEEPTTTSTEINDGSVGRVCPQSSGNWSIIATRFATYYEEGKADSFPYSTVLAALPETPLGLAYDPRTTEDCLFLDVIAPKSGFDQRNASLPVLIWVTGGGYTSGEKTGYGAFTPAGLFTNGEFVFVTINYRLGAFGFLGGDEVEANGTPNAAFFDQRLAFEWVQRYIHLFGGDKNRVTVMGASAGAGSLMHHLTAYGGDGTGTPFQQAILFSPAFAPSTTNSNAEAAFQDLMSMLGVSSLAELREVDSEDIISANALQIYSHSAYGSNTYGPYVDGTFVTALPGTLLKQGRFDQGLSIMVSHNTLEGLTFTDPTISTDEDYNNMIEQRVSSNISESEIDVVKALYPPIYQGGLFGYNDEFDRARVTIEDAIIVCNTRYLESAYYDRSYGIQFAVPPGIHGEETDYIFNNGATSGVDLAVATRLQEAIVSFVRTGMPISDGTALPLYGKLAHIRQMNNTGDATITDDAASVRCAFWQDVF